MFSHQKPTWQVQTVNMHFEIGYNRDTPITKKMLRNYSAGITLSIYPYRMYFDPGMFSDNYCRIDIEFKNGIPESLSQSLHSFQEKNDGSWQEDSFSKLSCLFDIKDKELDTYLTMLENYLFNASKDKISMLEGFNQLRDFLNLPTIDKSSLSHNSAVKVTSLQSSLLEGFIGLRK